MTQPHDLPHNTRHAGKELQTNSTQRAQALELLGARSVMRLKDFAAQGIGPETLTLPATIDVKLAHYDRDT